MSNYDDWDQCEACGKQALLSDLNEEGMCPTCSAELEDAGDVSWEELEDEEEE